MWFRNLFDSLKPQRCRKPVQPTQRVNSNSRLASCQLAIDTLEDRCVPAAVLSVWDATILEGDTGVFSFHGPEEFYLDFVRQFEFVDADGEHDRYEQLHCEFRFPAAGETVAFGRYQRWWFRDDDEPWATFVDEIERRPEFKALATAIPSALTIEQEAL